MTVHDDRPVEPRATGGPPRGFARRWLRPAAVAGGLALVVLTPVWAPLLLRRLDFFRVRRVEVVGVRYIQPRDIVELLAVDTTASVWDDPDPLAARVARHPLVRDVEIDRKLPGTLVVRLVEHAPVALVATARGFRAYDERGVALPIDPAGKDVNVPIIARPDTVLLRLLGNLRLDAPGLYARISEMRRDGGTVTTTAAEGGRGRQGGRGDLYIVLDSLPVRVSPDITLQRLTDIELVEQDLARRRLRAVELDLRFRDQVIARLP